MKKITIPSDNQYCQNSIETVESINQLMNSAPFSRANSILSYLNSSLIKCDIEHVNILINNKLAPYPMEHNYKFENLQHLGNIYFSSHIEYAQHLALAIHDWTTASFFRKKILLHYKYNYNPHFSNNTEHDIESIAEIFFRSSWYTYTPYNQNFAESFFISPIPKNISKDKGVSNIKAQLANVIKPLSIINAAESRLLETALRLLPKPTKEELPLLARGAFKYSMEIEEALDYANTNATLYYPVQKGSNSFLSLGNIITSRTVWSFVDNLQDAKKYTQGMIVIATLHKDCSAWECPYITPFATNTSKIEYACPPGTKWLISGLSEHDQKISLELVQLCGSITYLSESEVFLG
jgi:hypothetical protein